MSACLNSTVIHSFHRIWVILLSSALTMGISCAVQAQPHINSPSWVLQHWHDPNLRQTLSEHNANAALPPASLTKLLTAYTALKLLDTLPQGLATQWVVPTECLAIEGTRVGYKPSEILRLQDALHGMLSISGNDAACAIAHLFGQSTSGFAQLMNQTAKTLNLSATQWQNPHGLDAPHHLASATDIAQIAHALWYQFPIVRPWLKQKTYTWNGITQHNRNSLLYRDSTVEGLKTGHTEQAGYNLATTQAWIVAIDNDTYSWRLSTVVMGAASSKERAQDSAALLQWGRSNFQAWRLYQKNDLAGHWLVAGIANTVPLYFDSSCWVVLHQQTNPDELQYVFEPLPNIKAPYLAKQHLGYVTVYNDKQPLTKVPVFTAHALDASPMYAMFWHWVKTLFNL